jgi:hypothetical protein
VPRENRLRASVRKARDDLYGIRDRAEDTILVSRARVPTRVDLRSFVVFLGPYRNLTTLTAASLGLHPNCRVLNHGLDRVLIRPSVDPFAPERSAEFRRFVRLAELASAGGRRGIRGGSIRASHAYDRGGMQEADEMMRRDRAPGPMRVLVWKESMRVVNYLRMMGIDCQSAAHRNSLLRFLVPVRNPMDSALSNVKVGQAQYLALSDPTDVSQALDAVLNELAIALRVHRALPDATVVLFQGEAVRPAFASMADRFGLDVDNVWLDAVERSWQVEDKPEHPRALQDQYRRRVRELFDWSPETRERLLAFAEPTS